MKNKILSIVIVVTLFMNSYSIVFSVEPFSNFKAQTEYSSQFADVRESDWFYHSVKQGYEYGLIKGSSLTTFSPNNSLTIAEAIALAARLHSIYTNGEELKVEPSPGKMWYDSSVEYALNNKIIPSAYSNYNVKATRSQVAEIFAKALPDEALGQIRTVNDNAIPDVPISAPYAQAVYKLYRAGILSGNDSIGTFNPKSNIKRSEIATICVRMADPIQRSSATIRSTTQAVTDIYVPAPSYASMIKTEEYQEILKAYALEDISWHEYPQTKIDWMENFYIAYMAGDWEFDTAETFKDADWACTGFNWGALGAWAEKHNDLIGVFINSGYGSLYFKDGKFYYNTSGATPNITEEELSSYVKENYEAIQKIYNDFHASGLINENSTQLEIAKAYADYLPGYFDNLGFAHDTSGKNDYRFEDNPAAAIDMLLGDGAHILLYNLEGDCGPHEAVYEMLMHLEGIKATGVHCTMLGAEDSLGGGGHIVTYMYIDGQEYFCDWGNKIGVYTEETALSIGQCEFNQESIVYARKSIGIEPWGDVIEIIPLEIKKTSDNTFFIKVDKSYKGNDGDIYILRRGTAGGNSSEYTLAQLKKGVEYRTDELSDRRYHISNYFHVVKENEYNKVDDGEAGEVTYDPNYPYKLDEHAVAYSHDGVPFTIKYVGRDSQGEQYRVVVDKSYENSSAKTYQVWYGLGYPGGTNLSSYLTLNELKNGVTVTLSDETANFHYSLGDSRVIRVDII